MRALVAAIVAICLAGLVVLLVAGDTTAGKASAVSMLGVASVLAVSMVFLAVGRSEDEEREAREARKRSQPPPEPPPEPQDPHPRPALERRRARPPRRPP